MNINDEEKRTKNIWESHPVMAASTLIVAIVCLVALLSYLAPSITSMMIAPKHREVVIYSSNSGITAIMNEIKPIFEEETGIEINLMHVGGSGTVVQRVIEEKNAPQADMIIASIPPILEAKKEGALEKYIPSNAEYLPEAYKDEDGYFTGWFAFYTALTYNPTKVSPKPSTYNDLLDPKFKGKISYADPRQGGNGIRFLTSVILAFDKDEDEAFDFLKKLESNVASHVQLASSTMVDRGELWIQLSDTSISFSDYFNGGMTNQVILVTEEGIMPGYVALGLVKDSKHPEEAKELINFLLSEEAQRFTPSGFGVPVRKDVSLSSDIAEVYQPVMEAKLLSTDWEWMLENMEGWKDRWQKEVLGE